MELLPRRPRRWQRLLLYGSLALVCVGMVALARWLRRPVAPGGELEWGATDWAALPEVRLLREYVRIDTTPATGSELTGARWLAEVLARHGVEAHLEELPGGRANLWAIVEGRRREALVLHHHIDTSNAARPEEWDYAPFSAWIDPPWLFGRGVFDMKSLAVAQLLAFLDAAGREPPPESSLILLATGGEEHGDSRLGARWVLREHPELTERFRAVLSEGGVVEATNLDTIKYWGIEFAQKQFAYGAACAASRTRLEDLRRELADRLERTGPERLTPEAAACFAAYGPTRQDLRVRAILGDPELAFHNPRRFRRLPAYVRSMLRAEVVAFGIERDPAGGWRLPLIVHLLPHTEWSAARARLLPDWLTIGTAVHLEPPLGADHGSPLDEAIYQRLAAGVRERFPEATVGPYLLPWAATDCRFFRHAEIPCYGFSPFVILTTDTLSVDAPNERIALPGYVGGVELYRELVAELIE